jgi:probable HAF family extracellular repeat protein
MQSTSWAQRVQVCLTHALILAFAALAPWVTAQDNSTPNMHHRYTIVDVGTFGGPQSTYQGVLSEILNPAGASNGTADTTIPDPFAPNCISDCFVSDAFVWRKGITTDLGGLPDSVSTVSLWINDNGTLVGISEKNTLDPLTGLPATDPVVWRKGHITKLDGFGGNSSVPAAINNGGLIVGGSANTVLDPFASNFPACGAAFPFMFFGSATQVRAALWQNGTVRDLGTLGGNDSAAQVVNESGQIAGESYTNTTPNPVTGVPTIDPFVWDRGKMTDLGSLGGTCGGSWWINNRGQVVGQSNLPGDVNFHAFLWDRGRMTDLGTLGGNRSSARMINNAGEVVGRADITGSKTRHGFLWKNGVMTDLGVVAGDPCSTAYGLNSSTQVVGVSSPCGGDAHGFLWENGGPIVDLNTLVAPGSGIAIVDAWQINDAGEIAAHGMLSNGDIHALVLVPCDSNHPGQCSDYSLIESTDPSSVSNSEVSPGKELAGRPAPTEHKRSADLRHQLPGS